MSDSKPSYYVGWDIGGTKCAVVIGEGNLSGMVVGGRREFATPPSYRETLVMLEAAEEELLQEAQGLPRAIGISCGGPLDHEGGRILSPPNLPGWDEVAIVADVQQHQSLPVALENDANAGALAEWWWGRGQGLSHLIFLTFGTGMGAGLILNGALYRGASDLEGEVGHIRLAETGPVGFGKAGSFEGFCSGGGMSRAVSGYLQDWLATDQTSMLADTIPPITARDIGNAAVAGDLLALKIFDEVGQWLGRGLSILIDAFNPEMIVLGSIYGRQQSFIEPSMRAVIQQEAISAAAKRCRIEPAGLGESIGDYASLAVALLATDDPDQSQV